MRILTTEEALNALIQEFLDDKGWNYSEDIQEFFEWYKSKYGTESTVTSTEDRNPETPNTSAGRTANEGEGVGGDTS